MKNGVYSPYRIEMSLWAGKPELRTISEEMEIKSRKKGDVSGKKEKRKTEEHRKWKS